MKYTVKFKKVGDLFWTKLKKVKGDFVANDIATKPRVFILEDDTRVEVATEGVVFVFSKERYLDMVKKAEKEAGQKLA